VAIFVDSNVILDVATDDPNWGLWSDQQITRHQSGGLWVNPVVYSELGVGAESRAEVDELLAGLKVQVVEVSRDALFLAAKAFQQYRKNGGVRSSPLPDFFIGAQAETEGVPLLTRDPARYRTYFPGVALICPP
jgi:predicted nucleic acid-binding protein